MRNVIALWRIAAPPANTLILASSLSLLEASLALLLPWLGGRFAEQVLGQEVADFRNVLLLILGALLLQQVMHFATSYLLGSAGARTTALLRQRLYDHLQSLPLHQHQQQDPGATLSLISRDAALLGHFFTSTLPSLAPQLITLLGALAIMAYLDLALALYIGMASPLLIIALRLATRRIRPIAERLTESHAAHLATVEENLRLIPLLKAFGQEAEQSARIAGQNDALVAQERSHLRRVNSISPGIQAFGALFTVSVLWLSADRLATERLDTAGAISLILYGLLIFRPVGQLATAAATLQSALGAATRIERTLQVPPEDLLSGSRTRPAHPGRIEFVDIRFAYPGQPPLFRDFSLSIQAGETLAITGRNGSGKSTLTHLLTRFYEPDEGQVRLDGIDIRTLNLGTLRGLIGLVPQQVRLLNASIRENIRFGMPDAGDEEIIKAAELAQAWAFIAALPDGLESRIGPDGIKLSGGQRQRIALARALLRRCPILIFDEATAMFDEQAERAFVDMAHEHLKDTTIILITHRPASLALADRVIELPPGITSDRK